MSFLFRNCRYASSCWLQLVLAALSALSQSHGLGVEEKVMILFTATVSTDTLIKSYNGHGCTPYERRFLGLYRLYILPSSRYLPA